MTEIAEQTLAERRALLAEAAAEVRRALLEDVDLKAKRMAARAASIADDALRNVLDVQR